MDKKSKLRWVVELSLGLLLVVGLVWAMRASRFSERLTGASDAWWWSAAPWVILVLLWVGIGAMWWKHQRRRREA